MYIHYNLILYNVSLLPNYFRIRSGINNNLFSLYIGYLISYT